VLSGLVIGLAAPGRVLPGPGPRPAPLGLVAFAALAALLTQAATMFAISAAE
jgi:hypothetical protein